MRQMAIESRGQPGLDYAAFKKRLSLEMFSGQQSTLLNIRLNLLESFMELPNTPGALYEQEPKPFFLDTKKGRANENRWNRDQAEKIKLNKQQNIWSFEPGSLTIIDLSCPFVDEAAACALFNMCLTLFLESGCDGGRIVALDEAHKVHLTIHLPQPVDQSLTNSSLCQSQNLHQHSQKHCCLSFANSDTSLLG